MKITTDVLLFSKYRPCYDFHRFACGGIFMNPTEYNVNTEMSLKRNTAIQNNIGNRLN